MIDALKSVMGAPLGTLLVVAGLVFLAVAIVGDVSGRIQPGRSGRIGAAFAGALLLGLGLFLQWPAPAVAPGPRGGTATGEPPPLPGLQRVTPPSPQHVATPDPEPLVSAAASSARVSASPSSGAQELQHGTWLVTLKATNYAETYSTQFSDKTHSIEPRNPAERLLIADVRLGNRGKVAFDMDYDRSHNTGIIDSEGRGYTPVLIDRREGVYPWRTESILPFANSFQALVFSVPRSSTPVELVWSVNDGETAFDAHFRIGRIDTPAPSGPP